MHKHKGKHFLFHFLSSFSFLCFHNPSKLLIQIWSITYSEKNNWEFMHQYFHSSKIHHIHHVSYVCPLFLFSPLFVCVCACVSKEHKETWDPLGIKLSFQVKFIPFLHAKTTMYIHMDRVHKTPVCHELFMQWAEK